MSDSHAMKMDEFIESGFGDKERFDPFHDLLLLRWFQSLTPAEREACAAHSAAERAGKESFR